MATLAFVEEWGLRNPYAPPGRTTPNNMKELRDDYLFACQLASFLAEMVEDLEKSLADARGRQQGDTRYIT